MADTIKSSNELKLEAGFYDNDTRTITLENPKSNLTKADILAVGNLAASTPAKPVPAQISAMPAKLPERR